MQSDSARNRPLRIAILGAGPGGLCTAIQLQRAGFRDFAIFEKSAGVGGTWWHNRYPGAACDVESSLYSFSFEPKLDWSRPYGTQSELQAYFRHCAEKYGLAKQLQLETEVRSARWSEAAQRWTLVTQTGEEFEAEVVVSAVGMFNELHWPEIPGLDAFRGTLFHSARWNTSHELRGESVGVIGSAASAVQFVPEIAKQVAQLHLFQRSANWVLPKQDTPFSEAELADFRAQPERMRERRAKVFDDIEGVITYSNPERLHAAEQVGLRALAVVRDPELRRKLTPAHPYGCKRPLLSNHYFPTFNRPNVELVTDPIERVSADAIHTRDGRQRRVDTIVIATGFETTRYASALDVSGRNGLRLADAWKEGARAYLGISAPGFPNFFMLYGPNTNNGSILSMIEAQVAYLIAQLERLQREELACLDLRPAALERYDAEIQRDISAVAVWQANCNGYYRSPSGRVVTQWPHTMSEYQRRTEAPELDAYETSPVIAGH